MNAERGPLSRRQFLGGVGAGVAVAAAGSSRSFAFASPRGGPARRPTVAVFGGGVAGLTAAHELAERGFAVTVYERRAWGGKARSTWVPNSARGGRKPLPGEHGFRVELGFYRNLPDTLRRIPFGRNAHGVFDNLVATPDLLIARDGGRPDLYLPAEPTKPFSIAPERIAGTLSTVLANSGLPPDATAYFAGRLVVLLSSGDRRRHEQWDQVAWTDFLAVDRFPDDYRKIFGELPRFFQAANARRASTDWMAQFFEAFVYCLSGRGDGPFVRHLNGPTNDTWIDPWIAHLDGLGVRHRLEHAIERLHVDRGRIAAAEVNTPTGRYRVEADYYVCALPVERARLLWNEEILAADPSLARMQALETDWMNGVKLFLSANRPIDRGVVVYANAPWALSSVNQAQIWADDFASTYGDGRVHDSLSVVIANWHAPGVIYGKPASECTPRQVVHEVWEQLKRSVNKPGKTPVLTDDLLISWDIDPGMIQRDGKLISDDPLVLPTVGTRPARPGAATAIPNLTLAGDYLSVDSLIATMEGANEAGRLAANAILERAGSRAAPVDVFPHFRPPEWDALKTLDDDRYSNGQPNLFDVDMTLDQLVRKLPH